MAERKTLLLTGASRGIGHATVKYFNAAGWRVFTASRQSWASECPWADGEENHIHLDLEDIPGVEASLELIREKLGDGRLHALVDNAGISPKGEGGERLGVLETDYATWLRVFNVNLFSTALLARGLFAELKAAQGTVINVTSIAGSKVHPFAGVAYATSKAALSALTREMAHDFGPHGVRVNAIAPGGDRHLDPVAGHRGDRRAQHPAAPPRPAGGDRFADLLPLHQRRILREWRGNPRQRRAARLGERRKAKRPTRR